VGERKLHWIGNYEGVKGCPGLYYHRRIVVGTDAITDEAVDFRCVYTAIMNETYD
jgi:hypothetical protein